MIDIHMGHQIIIGGTAKKLHTMLVREGCDGSPNCALEIYVAEGPDYLGDKGVNLHMNFIELDSLYRAVKAVRKAHLERTENGKLNAE